MIEIVWHDYLRDENLKTCSNEHMDSVEAEIGFKLPESLRHIMMNHGGQSPENLIPVIYPSGYKSTISCIYHAYDDADRYDGYTIPFMLSCLDEQGFVNLVPFSNKGNVFLVLDYRQHKENPPVCFLFREGEPDDPDLIHQIASNFNEFLEKYTIEYVEDDD